MIIQKLQKSKYFASRFLIGIFCLLFLVSSASCGRRGDPVPLVPREESIAREDAVRETESSDGMKEEAGEGTGIVMPDPPAGLIGLYTQKAVVLTWDEDKDDGIKKYKVYRSDGGEYVCIGETATPAFTDSNVSPATKYYYNVTAVGELESRPSKDIAILTEVH